MMQRGLLVPMVSWNRKEKREALPAPTPEQIAYEEAKKAADRRSRFYSHLVVYATTCAFLFFVAGFTPAMIVALSWGIGIASHYYKAVLGPELKKKWIDEEVRQRLDVSVAKRVTIEGKHARSLEQLSASIAHEIRNPITAAKSLAQQIGEDPSAPENVEHAKVVVEELDRVERSISHLLRYARDEELRFQPVEMNDVIDAALETFRDRLASGVRLERDLHADGRVRGDAEKLRRVLINLIANALDAMEQAGTPDATLQISSGLNLAGNELWVRVRDNGPGISTERLAKIFDPFHTSKANGTGLGLALTKKSVEAHGGSIEVSSEEGLGTELVLTFPRTEDRGGRMRRLPS